MSLSLEGATALNGIFAVATAGAALTGLSGAASTYATSAFGFSIDGIAYAKAAVSTTASPTTDGNTGLAITLTANKARAIVWGVNAAGTFSVYAGPIVDYIDTTAGNVFCLLPSLPSGVIPFAAHTVQGGSSVSGTWTFGSSNWNATGISAITVKNLCQPLTKPLPTV
jgi:hypothetical protein